MPTVMSHAVVGIALGTWTRVRARRPLFWIVSAALPMLPDLDVAGLWFGIPFRSMWGHRGISHSVLAALVIGTGAALLLRRRLRTPLVPLALFFAAITATHGLLDALTTGGPGVAFWAPFDDTRYFFPWRPIPVSPLATRFFSERGWRVFQAELLVIWLPAAVVAVAGWLRERSSSSPSAQMPKTRA
jgi:inner membrane protein